LRLLSDFIFADTPVKKQAATQALLAASGASPEEAKEVMSLLNDPKARTKRFERLLQGQLERTADDAVWEKWSTFKPDAVIVYANGETRHRSVS
jgi:hypothetical protein